MGKIIGAYGMSHVMFEDTGIEDQAKRVFDGLALIGEKIRADKPDVVVIISGDHFYNVSTGQQSPLGVAVGDTHVPFGDMDIPKTPFRGHRAFAEGFLRFAAEAEFDLTKLEEEGFKPDHGSALPNMFINPAGDIPTVILNININMDPVPTPQRCWRLGQTLKDYVERARPDGERVAVVAAGGLSHWLMIERDGEINAEWDEQVLADFAAGEAEKYAGMTIQEIAEISGNGGVELIFWLAMAATAPGARGEKLFYEPVYQWKTGMAGLELHV